MAYTSAKVKQIDPPDLEQGRIRVVVAFTGNAGEPEVDQVYWIDGGQTVASLQAQIAAKCTALNNVVTVRQAITVNQTISVTPPADPTPTQSQLDIQTFRQDYAYLQQAQKAISAGLLDATNTTYQALLTRTKNEFATVVADVGAAQALTYL